MSKQYKQENELDKNLLLTKKFILILIPVFFVILIFLTLMPKESDIIKGVTYDLKYPKINHYSQIPLEVFEQDFKLMKKAGINTIRLYGAPPEFILDLADKYGIRVIETVVFPGDWIDFTSPYQLQALKREAIRNIDRDIDRECIYAWSIWNDAPWTYGAKRGDVIKVYGKERVSQFLRELYKAVKKRDPLRPVTAATLTVDEDAKNLGTDFLDILGYNVYLGITDWRNGNYDSKLTEKIVDELASISRKYKKPVIITETGYSTYWRAELQEDVISDQIKKVDNKLKGIILFQWADDWSKAGNFTTQDNNIEEHWGVLEGGRKPKGGYYAVKQMFKNTLFRSVMLAASDYCRGTYFATKKRALRSTWKEDIIKDEEIEGLKSQLDPESSIREVSIIIEKLSQKFFERKGFDQFALYLEGCKAAYKDSAYRGLLDYYIALAGWVKLEYLAGNGMWELYYAEKAKGLNKILDRLELAEKETMGTDSYQAVLYLEWVIHNDLLDKKENVALEKFEGAIKNYSESIRNAAPLMTYSKLLNGSGEAQLSERLLREYVANIGRFMDAKKAASLLKREAEDALSGGYYERAKILYDAYLDVIVRNYSEEDASFEILELAATYKLRSLFEECIEVCERLLKEFPGSELADDAAYAIGVALKEKKSYSRAVQTFRDFILKFPNSDLSKGAIKEALSMFAIYPEGTRAEKTVSFLKEVIGSYPNNDFSIMARFELASSLASLNRKEEALREYQYIIDNHPNSEYANYSKRSIERLAKEE